MLKSKSGRRIQITHIHPEDAHYLGKDRYIGLTGIFEPTPPHRHRGYYAGEFYPDPGSYLFFKAVRYKRI